MVSRLIRTRYGTVAMPSVMKRGDMIELEPAAVAAVLDSAGLRSRQSQTQGHRGRDTARRAQAARRQEAIAAHPRRRERASHGIRRMGIAAWRSAALARSAVRAGPRHTKGGGKPSAENRVIGRTPKSATPAPGAARIRRNGQWPRRAESRSARAATSTKFSRKATPTRRRSQQRGCRRRTPRRARSSTTTRRVTERAARQGGRGSSPFRRKPPIGAIRRRQVRRPQYPPGDARAATAAVADKPKDDES